MFFCSDKKSICISLKIDAPATGSPGGSTDMSMSEVSRVQGCHYDIANKTNYLLGSTPTSGRFGTFDRIYRLFKKDIFRILFLFAINIFRQMYIVST